DADPASVHKSVQDRKALLAVTGPAEGVASQDEGLQVKVGHAVLLSGMALRFGSSVGGDDRLVAASVAGVLDQQSANGTAGGVSPAAPATRRSPPSPSVPSTPRRRKPRPPGPRPCASVTV